MAGHLAGMLSQSVRVARRHVTRRCHLSLVLPWNQGLQVLVKRVSLCLSYTIKRWLSDTCMCMYNKQRFFPKITVLFCSFSNLVISNVCINIVMCSYSFFYYSTSQLRFINNC